MEFRELSVTGTDIEQLEQLGFSSEQITDLFRLKELYSQEIFEASHKTTPEHRRQAFIQWLYREGRLES
jgi:hypothetical protein